jgi:hypothetical protein
MWAATIRAFLAPSPPYAGINADEEVGLAQVSAAPFAVQDQPPDVSFEV